VSPLGQAAPMNWWGIHVRLSTTDDLIYNNTIRNAVKGGIGLSSVESGNQSAGERRIKISHNIVSNTNGPAIYLTPTSGSDAPGSDLLYASPVITAATTSNVSGTGIAGSTVEVYQASRLAGQSGLPSAFLGTGLVAGNGTWSIPVTAAQNSVVTALEIAPNGNTSMLGTNVGVTFAPPPPAPVANFDWSQEPGALKVDFTDSSTNGPTNWTWDFGDGGSSTLQNATHTYSVAGNYSVKLTASNGGGSDSETKTVSVNPLSGATVYAADSFGRTIANGWSNAEIGGTYTLLNSNTSYSVGSGLGSMSVNNAGGQRAAFLDQISVQDVDLSYGFTVYKAPAGGSYWVYAVARRSGTNEYHIKVRMLTDGRVGIQASKVINNAETPIGSEVIVSGLTLTPGALIRIHAQVVGNGSTAFFINARADGQSEPAGWQYTSGDTTAALQSPGSVGLRSYLGSSVSTAPVMFSFDDFSVNAPQ
jgi:PKD repeat protein